MHSNTFEPFNCVKTMSTIEQILAATHPTRHQLYGHLPPIMKTIQARRTRHAGNCWRSKDELISDVLLWTPRIWPSKSRMTSLNIQQLCEDTGCSPEDLPEMMNDREKWRETIRDICASGTTLWWWLLNRIIRAISLMSKVFANGPGDQGSIPGWIISKTQKMVLDAILLSTQHYKVRIKGKVEQSRQWSSGLPNTSV